MTREEIEELEQEELFCIGCGSQIQTDHKTERGYTPMSALKKDLRVANYIANAVSVCVIITNWKRFLLRTMSS